MSRPKGSRNKKPRIKAKATMPRPRRRQVFGKQPPAQGRKRR